MFGYGKHDEVNSKIDALLKVEKYSPNIYKSNSKKATSLIRTDFKSEFNLSMNNAKTRLIYKPSNLSTNGSDYYINESLAKTNNSKKDSLEKVDFYLTLSNI